MIRILAETHCHTLASTHAYSTLGELAAYAKEIGLEAIAVTDHAPGMTDTPHLWHFQNEKFWPKTIGGVRILSGVELDVLDTKGTLALSNHDLSELDVVNISCHKAITPAFSFDEMTEAYKAVLRNPYIHIIGHAGSPNYAFDIDRVMKVAAEYGKSFEINNHSFVFRKERIENCIRIAKSAKQHGVKLAVSTDAHICYSLGHTEEALALLEEVGFPEEQILNRTLASLTEFLDSHKKK